MRAVEQIVDLAREIDRTVLTVGTHAGHRHRERFLESTNRLSPAARQTVPRLAYFANADRVTEDFAAERIPYTAAATVRAGVAEMVEAGVLESKAAGMLGTGAEGRPIFDGVVDGRAELAAELWGDHSAIGESMDPITLLVREAVPADSTVAAVHASIPESDEPAQRFYQRLTTIRYVRADAHRQTWRREGLTGPDMVILSALWSGETATASTGLIDRGLADRTGLTEQGRLLRDHIEAETNTANARSLSMLDDELIRRLVDGLRRLPGTPRERPF